MLVPTRELALQTSAIVKEIGKHTGVQCMVRTRTKARRVQSVCLCVCFGSFDDTSVAQQFDRALELRWASWRTGYGPFDGRGSEDSDRLM